MYILVEHIFISNFLLTLVQSLPLFFFFPKNWVFKWSQYVWTTRIYEYTTFHTFSLCDLISAQVELKHIIMQITPNNILAIPLKWCALQCPLQLFFVSCRVDRSALKIFTWGGSPLRYNPLPFYVPFMTEMVPLSYAFLWQMVPLSHTKFTMLHPF